MVRRGKVLFQRNIMFLDDIENMRPVGVAQLLETIMKYGRLHRNYQWPIADVSLAGRSTGGEQNCRKIK